LRPWSASREPQLGAELLGVVVLGAHACKVDAAGGQLLPKVHKMTKAPSPSGPGCSGVM
jgi:hypothetical protein